MICGTASEALTEMRHHSVQVIIEAESSGYLVTVEESCTRPKGVGLEHVELVKKAVERFATLDLLFEKEDAVSGGFDSLGLDVGISQDLLGDAFRDVVDQINDLLLHSGAANFDYSGALVIDWDEDACRALIRKANDD